QLNLCSGRSELTGWKQLCGADGSSLGPHDLDAGSCSQYSPSDAGAGGGRLLLLGTSSSRLGCGGFGSGPLPRNSSTAGSLSRMGSANPCSPFSFPSSSLGTSTGSARRSDSAVGGARLAAPAHSCRPDSG